MAHGLELTSLTNVVKLASGSVFHYTSAEGLRGIVTSKTLWASEAASMNDRAEIRQGWELIRRLLEHFPSGEVRDLLMDLAEDPAQGSHEVFVVSGSTAADDANQWRLYADQGRGYVVELDASIQLTAVSEQWAPVPLAGHRSALQFVRDSVKVTPWLHVLYDESDVERGLDQLIRHVEAQSRAIGSSGAPPHVLDDLHESLRDEADEALATIAHLVKTPGFAGEHEVRVAVTFPIFDEKIQYRAGSAGIVAYGVLTTSPTGRGGNVVRPAKKKGRPKTALPVRSVRLGPLLPQDHERTVSQFLRRNGLKNVDIQHSGVPLR